VTYPNAQVQEAIAQRFVACKIDTSDDANAALVRRFHQAWTPDVRVLDAEGTELYRWNGYLPPYEFLAQLLVGEGQAWLRLGESERAAVVFAAVTEQHPTAACAPEALYFLGVARYKASHEAKELVAAWHALKSRYPESTWRVRQSFSETP
jgi:hypothetical protein